MRLRITFAKQEALRYTGHLDLHKIWERTARRADLPLAYSQGFHPQPKIYVASALPLGFSSRCEVLDMIMKNDVRLDGLRERIQACVPSGLQILGIVQVEDSLPALQTQVLSAEYEVTFTEPIDQGGLDRRIAALLEAGSLPRERRGKPYDLRLLVEGLSFVSLPTGEGSEVKTLFMRLAAREGATGRPEEVLDQLGISIEIARVERTCLIFREQPVQ